MAIFKKRGEKKVEPGKTPELPELPQLPELPNIDETQSTKLPSFPASKSRSMGDDLIKHAVSEKPEIQRPPIQAGLGWPTKPPIQTKAPKTREIGSEREMPSNMEISKWEPPKTATLEAEPDPDIHRSKPMSEIGMTGGGATSAITKTTGIEKPKKIGPVFVRIDKFENAISSFHEIKKKVVEIESLLKTVKDIRSKEETELSEWEAELQDMKSKIENIDKNLFSGLN